MGAERTVSMAEMELRSEVARLQQLLRITTEALEALAGKCMSQSWRDSLPELKQARAALAKARGEKNA